MNSTDYLELGVKTVGHMCEQYNVPLADLLAVFPNRPTSKEELNTIAGWLGKTLKAREAGTAAPTLPAPAQAVRDMPKHVDKHGKPMAMRYAIREADGVVRFYRVKQGNKPGFWFIDIQASDSTYPIKNYARKESILRAIAQDPEAALRLYGTELGSCGHCGRILTDPNSIAEGIGPVCLGKLGW